MSRKSLYILIFLFAFLKSLTVVGQKYEFNVERPKVEITTRPSYPYLFQNSKHPLKIEVSDSTRNFRYELAGGELLETDSGLFMLPQSPNEAFLNIYETYKGNEKLVYSLKYIVADEPKALLRGKPTNSAILDVLLVSGELSAITKINNIKIPIEVKSFSVIYPEGDSFKEVLIKGDKLPVPIRKELMKLTDGTLIYYENIKVEINNVNVTIPSYRATIKIVKSGDVKSFGL